MIPCCGTHSSRQRINNKSIQEQYKIRVLVAEAYRYVVQFRPYQGAKKGKQVAPCTKWGLGENVVLRLLECLSISHLFVCLSTFELVTFKQQVSSTKIGYANLLSLGTNSCKKKELGHCEPRISSKKTV